MSLKFVGGMPVQTVVSHHNTQSHLWISDDVRSLSWQAQLSAQSLLSATERTEYLHAIEHCTATTLARSCLPYPIVTITAVAARS